MRIVHLLQTVICNINVEEESIEPLPTLTRNETRETVAAAEEAYQKNFQPNNARFILSFSKDRIRRVSSLVSELHFAVKSPFRAVEFNLHVLSTHYRAMYCKPVSTQLPTRSKVWSDVTIY